MISATQLSAASAFIYAVTFAVLFVRMRRIPERLHRFCHLLLFVVGLAVVAEVLTVAGVGSVALAGAPVQLPRMANDTLGYAVMWGLVGLLGNASRRDAAVAFSFPILWIFTFQFGAMAGGLVGTVSVIFVLGCHALFLYLFWGPIWKRAQQLSDERRLLFRKMRNTLYFLNSMITVYAFLMMVGAFTMLGITLIGDYVAVLVRVGLVGLFLSNLDALDADATDSETAPTDYAGPSPDAAD